MLRDYRVLIKRCKYKAGTKIFYDCEDFYDGNQGTQIVMAVMIFMIREKILTNHGNHENLRSFLKSAFHILP
jgi:hypothetical protein